MKFETVVAAVFFLVSFPEVSYSVTVGPHHRGNGGPGNILEDTTTVSIGLTGITNFDPYCTHTKKRPKHPQAKGSIVLSLPDDQPPLIAGDGARRVPNQWIHNPDPLPENPNQVIFTCSNAKALPAGEYGYFTIAYWMPHPAPCWSSLPFEVNVTGGIVVPNPGGMSGKVYIPKLKSMTAKVAPDHKGREDEGRSRAEIGAGEHVNLYVEHVPSSFYVDWQESGDAKDLNKDLHGGTNQFTATKPGAASGTATLTAAVTTDWGNVVIDKTFSVLTPGSVTTRAIDIDQLPMDVGTVGAKMNVMVKLHPTNVSFSDIYVREKGLPNSPDVAPYGVTGFYNYILFLYGEHVLNHVPKTSWVNPDEENNECKDEVEAEHPGWPQPAPGSPSGSFYWRIPLVWEVDQSKEGDEFFRIDQRFDLDANGTMTITKKEATVTRSKDETHGH